MLEKYRNGDMIKITTNKNKTFKGVLREKDTDTFKLCIDGLFYLFDIKVIKHIMALVF